MVQFITGTPISIFKVDNMDDTTEHIKIKSINMLQSVRMPGWHGWLMHWTQ